jgi:hypothetical protein
MGDLMIVKVVGLNEVVFRDAAATFTVRDKRIWTNDLSLFSETVDLSLKGSVGFDQTLEFIMSIQYSNAVLRGALDTGGIVPMVIQQAGEMISRYRIRGTMKKPVYEKEGLPVGKAVGKGIGNLVQSLVQ